uniref:Uncharacterized protein n=1 Tax=Vespula pensylvanica TaxID=30213 RepID=A0A834PC21_VESPE|nr:hypothetical protein H0235_003461 [Vespula pensylvanica]
MTVLVLSVYLDVIYFSKFLEQVLSVAYDERNERNSLAFHQSDKRKVEAMENACDLKTTTKKTTTTTMSTTTTTTTTTMKFELILRPSRGNPGLRFCTSATTATDSY